MQPAASRSFPPTGVLAAITAAGTLLAWWAFHGSVTNYDALWSLSWAHDILDGHTPGYELDGAATPHPLTTALAVVANLAGEEAARDATRGAIYLAAGLVVALTAGLAHRLAGPVGAAFAVVALALCSPLATATALAFQDVIAAALLLLAVTLAVAAPRRVVPPFAALAAAGLVRPEMWGLAACWWLAQFSGRHWGERLRLAAWAALGPALWMLTDLLATGDPLFSFHHTREGAADAQRVTGVSNAPRVLYDNLRLLFSREVLVFAFAALGGLTVVGWRRRGNGAGVLVVPVTAGLLVAAFLVMAAGELSLLVRYLLPLAGLLAVGYGVGAGAWASVPVATPVRLAWAAAAVLSVVLSITFVRGQIDLTQATVDNARIAGTAVDDLHDLRSVGAVAEAGTRCGRLTTRTTRTSIALAEGLTVSPSTIDVRLLAQDATAIGPATLVLPATAAVRDALERIGAPGGPLPARPAGGRRVAGNASWVVVAVGC